MQCGLDKSTTLGQIKFLTTICSIFHSIWYVNWTTTSDYFKMQCGLDKSQSIWIENSRNFNADAYASQINALFQKVIGILSLLFLQKPAFRVFPNVPPPWIDAIPSGLLMSPSIPYFVRPSLIKLTAGPFFCDGASPVGNFVDGLW